MGLFDDVFTDAFLLGMLSGDDKKDFTNKGNRKDSPKPFIEDDDEDDRENPDW